MGIASSAPTTAMGIIGTPARMAISTKPPRPKRRQLVAVGERLDGPLGALGEDQRQLLLVVQQPVGVVGMGRHPAAPAPQVPITGMVRKK